MRSVLPFALALRLCAALAPNPASAQAQTQGPLSADASDPRVMGWMQGFPPPPERLMVRGGNRRIVLSAAGTVMTSFA